MRLMRVKRGNHLHYPDTHCDRDDAYRGGEGYVVDLDAPYEADVLCKGQEYKLEPAPEGAKANEIEHVGIKRWIKDQTERDARKPKPKPEVVAAKAAAASAGMPAVDPIPTRPSKR